MQRSNYFLCYHITAVPPSLNYIASPLASAFFEPQNVNFPSCKNKDNRSGPNLSARQRKTPPRPVRHGNTQLRNHNFIPNQYGMGSPGFGMPGQNLS